MPLLNSYRLSTLSVDVLSVLDCRDTAAMGLSADELLHDTEYSAGHKLAAAAIARGAEGILVPSATRLGDNVVLFPNRLHPESRLAVIEYRDGLRLFPENR